MDFEVGTTQNKKQFNCYECALKYYEEVTEDKKYLSELNYYNRPKKIILNTYGWKNN